LAGLCRMKPRHNTSAISAIPMGAPGWPELAFWTASMLRARMALASSRDWGAADIGGSCRVWAAGFGGPRKRALLSPNVRAAANPEPGWGRIFGECGEMGDSAGRLGGVHQPPGHHSRSLEHGSIGAFMPSRMDSRMPGTDIRNSVSWTAS